MESDPCFVAFAAISAAREELQAVQDRINPRGIAAAGLFDDLARVIRRLQAAEQLGLELRVEGVTS